MPISRPLDHLTAFGERHAPALVTKAETIDYATLEVAVGRLARELARRVPEPGARVATWLPKTVEACLMPLAAARAGLVHVPINPVLKRAQVAHILSDSSASLLLTGDGRVASLEPGDLPPTCRVWDERDARAARAHGPALPPSEADPGALVAILYTSGSTGRPKGVMLSHANLWLGALSVAEFLQLRPGDRILGLLPLGFDYGQNQLLSTWAAGASVRPLDFLTARDVFKAIGEGITTLAAVPPLWLQLLEADVAPAAGVRRLTNSGGALTPSLIARMQVRFPGADVYPMYGLTEAFRSTYLPPALVPTHPTSMGRAIPFAEVMAVAADGREAADGEPGELVHAGPLVAQGYWRDTERTAQRFRPAPPFSDYGGMAVWSGDTVTRDAAGLFHFVGRDDEMIKSSGHRISPLEIEEAALASNTVVEAVAHGVQDDSVGQVIRLVVRGTGDDATLRRYLKRELPGHMQPRWIDWRADLPYSANGKLDRAAIARELSA